MLLKRVTHSLTWGLALAWNQMGGLRVEMLRCFIHTTLAQRIVHPDGWRKKLFLTLVKFPLGLSCSDSLPALPYQFIYHYQGRKLAHDSADKTSAITPYNSCNKGHNMCIRISFFVKWAFLLPSAIQHLSKLSQKDQGRIALQSFPPCSPI